MVIPRAQHDLAQIHRLAFEQGFLFFERCEVQQAFQQVTQAAGLGADVVEEARALVRGHVGALQDLARAEDGGHGALQLVRETLHVAFDIFAAFQSIAHVFECFRERFHLMARHVRRRAAFATAHRQRMLRQCVQRSRGPACGEVNAQQHEPDGADDGPLQPALRFPHKGQHAALRFRHADDADRFPIPHDWRGDIHDHGERIIGAGARAARPVLTSQREIDVPLVRDAAHGLHARGVKQHATLRIGDIDLQIDFLLRVVVDLRMQFARMCGAHGLFDGLRLQNAILCLRGKQLGQNVRHIDHRLLRGLHVLTLHALDELRKEHKQPHAGHERESGKKA